MSNESVWVKRAPVEPGTGIGAIPRQTNIREIEPIEQVLACRGDIDVSPLTGPIGIAAEAHAEHYLPAVTKIVEYVLSGKDICVAMDFDCDGVTAGASMVYALSQVSSHVHWVVPNRLTDSHGINVELIQQRMPSGLVITVDNGVTGVEETKKLKELGYEVVITDHHLQEGDLPDTTICDPKLFLKEGDDEYMAPGVYVSAKIALMVVKRCQILTDTTWDAIWEVLVQFTALGIVSDVIELNTLMRHQLQVGIVEIRMTTHSGIKALLNVCKVGRNQPIYATYMSYAIVPKINAMGRMGMAEKAVELLLMVEDISDWSVNSQIAAEAMKSLNAQRKVIEQGIYDDAVLQAEEYIKTHQHSLIVYKPNWHVGVIGVVASRLSEDYARSTLVVTEQNGICVASGRTVEGRDLFKEVMDCGELLLGGGGHKMACGCQFEKSNLEAVQAKFEENCAAQGALQPITYQIDADVTVMDLYDIKFQIWCLNFEPFGNSNPPLIFRLQNVRVYRAEPRGQALNIVVRNESQMSVVVSKFRAPEEWKDLVDVNVDLLLSPSFLCFGGKTSVEWRIIDLKKRGV